MFFRRSLLGSADFFTIAAAAPNDSLQPGAPLPALFCVVFSPKHEEIMNFP